MKLPTIYSFCLTALLLATGVISSLGRPIDFSEVSLLVRAKESDSSIRDEVAQRKLIRALTPQQEATLKAQGASDALVQSLRNASYIASPGDLAGVEATHSQTRVTRAEPTAEHAPKVTVMNVAFGHPVNLSQWGGADYEIAFYSYRFAGEDYIEPALVDPIRTGTYVSRTISLQSEDEAFRHDRFPTNQTRNWRYTPYDAREDLRDQRFNFSDSVAVSSHSFARPRRIDWENPVRLEGQPYNFFPVYGAGGVSLYFIGKASDRSAMVAVVSDRGL